MKTELEEQLHAARDVMTFRLEGAWTRDEIDAVAESLLAAVISDPELLDHDYPDRDTVEAFQLEMAARVYAVPRRAKVHVSEGSNFQEDLRHEQDDLRRWRSESRQSSVSRRRGRSRRSSSNSRSRGSRRTSSAGRSTRTNSDGGSRGDPDGDPDPTDPDDRDRRETKGRHCLGCGAGIDPARRADARYCPGSACRKAYVRRGRVAAEPLVPDSPDLVGSIRASIEKRDRLHAIAEFRDSIRHSPKMAHRYRRDLSPAIDALYQSAAHEYRRERAAVLAGRVEL